MRTLIVDDDFISRKVLTGLLSPMADCDVAIDGREAIFAFKLALEENRPYDLLCMDVMMPRLDGVGALKDIRAIEAEHGVDAASEVKALMVTALGDPKTVFDAYYLGGATSYLVKPVRKEKLFNELREFGLIK
jgi:two-component system chemotaxis response regulator CheY